VDKPKNTSVGIAGADHARDADWMIDVVQKTLRNDNPDPTALRMIADMIDPSSKKGAFRLILKLRRGNKSQANDAFFDRIDAFEVILNESDTETEAVKSAAMPVAEGGLSVSEATAYSYLRAIKAARAE